LSFDGILLNEVLPISRNVGVDEDRIDRALWLAKTTVDTLVRIDENLVVAFVDAVHGANSHAGLILDSDAGFSYNVRHTVYCPDSQRFLPVYRAEQVDVPQDSSVYFRMAGGIVLPSSMQRGENRQRCRVLSPLPIGGSNF